MVGNPSNLIVSVGFEAHLGIGFRLLGVLGGEVWGFTVNIYLFFKLGKHKNYNIISGL